MTTQTKLPKLEGVKVDFADRVTLLVAAQVQAGRLEFTSWADLILKAAKVERAIRLAAKDSEVSLRTLDEIIGDRHR